MTGLTHDSVPVAAAPSRRAGGLALAVASAASFGLSGSLARGLLDTGWTPGAVVAVRIALAALVLAVPAALSLRGRWQLLRRNALLLVVYGVLAVAGAQFCYFSAVARMPVGPALLIEYTAPAAVVAWLWLRRGQRPGRLTVVGAVLAAAGLVLVLDLLTGTALDPAGIAWALGAMVGAATYFVISADEDNGLPPLALAAGGLVVAAVLLGVLAAARVLPMAVSTRPAVYAGTAVPWGWPLVALGLVTAALAYVTGIAAGRRLGSRLASFVALLEVVAAVGFAWLLLGELPRTVQLLGGLLVLAGIAVVKLGEVEVGAGEPVAGR